MSIGIAIDIREKRYRGRSGQTGPAALSGFCAQVQPGEFCAIVGPSGCGKTTLLNIVAGLDRDFSGALDFAPAAPRIGYVFQQPRLLPWRTVRENVALVLPRNADTAAVDRLLGETGLADAAGFYPGRLSGGMARRAALARALAIGPDLLLMDEPFVSLDKAAADRLRLLLVALLSARSTTVLFVTHDAGEAVALADRVLLLSPAPGRVAAEMPLRLPREMRRDPVAAAKLQAELARLAADIPAG